jgi:hypothetical protein
MKQAIFMRWSIRRLPGLFPRKPKANAALAAKNKKAHKLFNLYIGST